MAQLVLGIAGAAIGSAFGMPQLGWTIGTAIGGLVASANAPGTEGPRLADKAVQISSYGAALPLVYGGTRLAGNVIWALPLIESASEQGGKGGPSVTTYSYAGTFAVAIAEGPIGGIRKIWADAKLVYDISSTADGATQAASALFDDYFTLYLGSESQLPDPTIEASAGAGQVEAFRGTAYMVFKTVPLADFGNRIPNLSFEVTTAAPAVTGVESIVPYKVNAWTGGTAPAHLNAATTYDSISLLALYGDAAAPISGTYTTISAAISAIESVLPGYNKIIAYTASDNATPSVFSGGASVSTDPEFVYVLIGRNPAITWAGTGADYLSIAGTSISPDSDPQDNTAGYFSASAPTSLFKVQFSDSVTPSPATYNYVGAQLTNYATPIYPQTGVIPDPPYVAGYYPTARVSRLVQIRVRRVPFFTPQKCAVGDPCALGIAQVPGNPGFCISCSGTVSQNITYTNEVNTFKQLRALTFSGAGVLTRNGVGPVLRPVDPNYSSSAYWSAAASAAGISGTYAVDFPTLVTQAGVGTASATASPAGTVLLSAIVTDVCARGGLSAGQIDVTALSDTVLGYKVSRQMAARSALEPLRSAFYFDAVENGRKIVFVKRGGSSVVTITADELGSSESGDPTPLIAPRRLQETELPAEIAVAYEAIAADYQTGTQAARRITTGSQQKVALELPIVMTDAKAAQVCDVLMYDAWAGRVERQFTTSRKYSKFLPTDVITVTDNEFTYRGRLTDKVENGPLIAWTMRDEDAAAYTPNSVSSVTSGGGSTTVQFDGPMRLVLLDIPLMRDADNSTGIYAAYKGYTAGWTGGAIYASTDNIAYTQATTATGQAVIGLCDTVLGNWTGGTVFDEVNSVAVDVGTQTLSSTTRDLMLTGPVNAAMVGYECIQYRTAALTSPGHYTLTGLLRGRRGTEFTISNHVSGENFVALTSSGAGMRRLPLNTSDIGATRYFKGVSNGGTVVDAASQALVFNNVSQRPWAPVDLRASLVGGTAAVTWKRRTRLSCSFTGAGGSIVPLGEASELYRVYVVRAGVIVSTTSVTTSAASVAALAADVINVGQVSDTAGTGYLASITV